MSNIGIPTSEFQLQRRNSEAREPTNQLIVFPTLVFPNNETEFRPKNCKLITYIFEFQNPSMIIQKKNKNVTQNTK